MELKKEDFYSGAFLSYLLNNGIVPALFDENNTEGRKIYDFTTDKGDFRVYVKYIAAPTSKSEIKNQRTWSFPFTDVQIDEIRELEKYNSRLIKFIFICGLKKLNGSKIAIADISDVFQCIDINRTDKYKAQAVKIRYIKKHRNFDMYGTARSDKNKFNDNTIKIKHNNIEEIFGIK